MSCLSNSTLFHKKSKGSLRRGEQADHRGYSHVRTLSTSSTVSRCSSVASHKSPGSFDPLKSHPPMLFNSSPLPIPEDEALFEMNPELQETYRRLTEKSYDNTSYEPSPVKDTEFYLGQRSRRRTYVYDQTIQWPLKDWQTIPPGLADMSETDFSAPHTPREPSTDHRRPHKEMSDLEMLVTRGDWKRRGIVFQLDSDDEAEQTQHFELPE